MPRGAALAGIRFGVFYRGFKINEDLPYEPWNIWKPGWVGMGWSAWDPRGSKMPPQMLNGTAVMGWIDSDGSQQVGASLGRHALDLTWSLRWQLSR